jgi:hypothetical protein
MQYDAKWKQYLKSGEKDALDMLVRDEELIKFRDLLPAESPSVEGEEGLSSDYIPREHSAVSMGHMETPPLPPTQPISETMWRFYINRWGSIKQRGWKQTKISTPSMPGYAISDKYLLVVCDGVAEIWRLEDRKCVSRIGSVQGVVDIASVNDEGWAAWVIENIAYSGSGEAAPNGGNVIDDRPSDGPSESNTRRGFVVSGVTRVAKIENQSISALRILSDGQLILGTLNGQIYQIDPSTGRIISYRTFVDLAPVLSVDVNLAQSIDSLELGEDHPIFQTNRVTSVIRTKGPFVIFLLKNGIVRMCSTLNNQMDVNILPPKNARCHPALVTPWYTQRGIWTNGKMMAVLYPDGTVGVKTVA